MEKDNRIINNKYIIIFNKYIQYDYVKYARYTILEWLKKYNLDNSNLDINENVDKYIILVNNYYIAYSNEFIINIFEKLQTNKIIIELIPKLKGGGLIDMFKSIIQIGKVFLILLDFIIWLIKFIAWFIFFLGWFLKFLFVDLITDFFNSLIVIIITLFRLLIDLPTGLFAFCVNSIGGWMTTIWGWDQSNLSKNDKNSNYFRNIDRLKGKKCYLTNNNTVPFSIILGTIICPPLGVFMDLGITGWFNILICLILTLIFYIPGLVYALLIIYS